MKKSELSLALELARVELALARAARDWLGVRLAERSVVVYAGLLAAASRPRQPLLF